MERDANDLPAFFEACAQGNLELVGQYLDTGVPINARDPHLGHTALHVAASVAGNTPLVSLLIQRGAEIDAVDTRKQTPLHFAADVDIAKAIVTLGAPQTPVEADQGLLPLPPSLRKQVRYDVNKVNEQGETPLFNAVRSKSLPLVVFLLEQRALVNKKNHQDYTCLTIACELGQTEMVRYLLDEMADHRRAGHAGWYALHNAAQGGHTAVCQVLIDKGADPNAATPDGITALHLAVSTCNPALLAMLLAEEKTDPTLKTKDGENALDWARRFNHSELEGMIAERMRKPSQVARDSDSDEMSECIGNDEYNNGSNNHSNSGEAEAAATHPRRSRETRSQGNPTLVPSPLNQSAPTRSRRRGALLSVTDIPVGALRKRRTSSAYVGLTGGFSPHSPVMSEGSSRRTSKRKSIRPDEGYDEDTQSIGLVDPTTDTPIFARRRRKTTTEQPSDADTTRRGYSSLQQRRNSAVIFPVMPEEYASQELSRALGGYSPKDGSGATTATPPVTPAAGLTDTLANSRTSTTGLSLSVTRDIARSSAPAATGDDVMDDPWGGVQSNSLAPPSSDALYSRRSSTNSIISSSDKVGRSRSTSSFGGSHTDLLAPTIMMADAMKSHGYNEMEAASAYTSQTQEQFLDDP